MALAASPMRLGRCRRTVSHGDSEKVRERLIDGLRRWEGLEYFSLQHSDKAAPRELAEVLSACAPAKSFSFQDRNVCLGLPCRCFVHDESPSWR